MNDEHTEDQFNCMGQISPLLAGFDDDWREAFAFYRSCPPEFMAEHDDTTTANCIRSHMWKRIFDRYDGKPEFHLFRLRGLNLLNWKDQFVFRFKKVDGSGRHQNYQTLQ